ncbi:hypothetical protein H5410_023322 [Solanum commersonii]|uniref:Uncharacterized protein n=1 Tax=Solanum commersonii TaxID=4109 RepID=A0A9J5ZGI4_SOLCO|nr:hypothetical protein H5410_023322 [Solanum commersonii]
MVGENKGKSDGANVAPGLLAENGRTVKKLKGHLVEDKDGRQCHDMIWALARQQAMAWHVRWPTSVVGKVWHMENTRSGQVDIRVDFDQAMTIQRLDIALEPKIWREMAAKSMNEPLHTALNKSSCTQANVAHMEPHGLLNDSSDLLVRNWKGVALKQMLQSLESDGGLTGCIQEALTSHSEASCAVEAKESGKCCEDGNRDPFRSCFTTGSSSTQVQGADVMLVASFEDGRFLYEKSSNLSFGFDFLTNCLSVMGKRLINLEFIYCIDKRDLYRLGIGSDQNHRTETGRVDRFVNRYQDEPD